MIFHMIEIRKHCFDQVKRKYPKRSFFTEGTDETEGQMNETNS